jgi:hypothetical protein
LFQTPSVSSQFLSLQVSALRDLPHFPRQTMDEFCPQFDRLVCQGGMYGPDASTDTAPRFENRYPEACLAERLRACESSNSSSDHHNLSNAFGHAFSAA